MIRYVCIGCRCRFGGELSVTSVSDKRYAQVTIRTAVMYSGVAYGGAFVLCQYFHAALIGTAYNLKSTESVSSIVDRAKLLFT